MGMIKQNEQNIQFLYYNEVEYDYASGVSTVSIETVKAASFLSILFDIYQIGSL